MNQEHEPELPKVWKAEELRVGDVLTVLGVAMKLMREPHGAGHWMSFWMDHQNGCGCRHFYSQVTVQTWLSNGAQVSREEPK